MLATRIIFKDDVKISRASRIWAPDFKYTLDSWCWVLKYQRHKQELVGTTTKVLLKKKNDKNRPIWHKFVKSGSLSWVSVCRHVWDQSFRPEDVRLDFKLTNTAV